jgi:glycine cleavage system H protein
MANQPQDLKYTKTHEWVRRRGQQFEVGITDFAQHQLSDITFVELPEVGRKLAAGAEAGVVESIKAASDIYAPVAGVVTEVNAQLAQTPEIINTDPYGQGWLFRLTPADPGAADRLMTSEQYTATLPKEP